MFSFCRFPKYWFLWLTGFLRRYRCCPMKCKFAWHWFDISGIWHRNMHQVESTLSGLMYSHLGLCYWSLSLGGSLLMYHSLLVMRASLNGRVYTLKLSLIWFLHCKWKKNASFIRIFARFLFCVALYLSKKFLFLYGTWCMCMSNFHQKNVSWVMNCHIMLSCSVNRIY